MSPGPFERFLIARGERVLRVPTKLMADSRRAAPGRAGSPTASTRSPWPGRLLREGLDHAPGRVLGRARARSAAAGRSPRAPGPPARRAQQHAPMAPARSVARARATRRRVVLDQVEHPDRPAPGARSADDARPDRPRRAATAARTHRFDPGARTRHRRTGFRIAPRLLSEPGFGALTAAKLVAEIAGAGRFATDAKLARAGGLAPIPVSSGKTSRRRLDRGGNRQINAAIHRVAYHPRPLPSRDPRLRRPQGSPKARRHRDAIRSLKRHLARRIWRMLQPPAPIPDQTITSHCF